MTNKPIYVTITIIYLLFTACSGSSNRDKYVKLYNKPSVEINQTQHPHSFNILDVEYSNFYDNVDSMKLIKLETSDESLIGSISTLSIIGNVLYVADYSKSKSVFAFDLQGNFLYKINNIGNGPGEYQNINMVQIDEKNIFILDWFSGKIMKYDLFGNFISEKKIIPHPNDFINLNNGEMIFNHTHYNEKKKYQIEFTDSLWNPIETAFPFKNTRGIFFQQFSIFQKLKDETILYRYSFCDTIFKIKDRKITPLYNLSFHVPEQVEALFEETKNMEDRDYFKRLMKNDLVRSFNFIELKNALFINYSKGMGAYVSLISKKDSKIYHSIAADKEYAYIFNVNGFMYEQNILLSAIDESFGRLLSNENKEFFYSLFGTKNMKLIKELEDTDNNPLVCILYINPLL